jgi:peptide methionine sulfoxide reductase MsrA
MIGRGVCTDNPVRKRMEKQEALAVIARIDALKVYEKPVDIDVVPQTPFWSAEEYHQDYAERIQ